jgi:hypothetical protein
MHSFRNLEAATKIWRGLIPVPDTNVYLDEMSMGKTNITVNIWRLACIMIVVLMVATI